MYQTAKTKRQLRLINAVFVVAFIAAIALLHWASREFHWRLDLTHGARHTLSPASVAALERLPGPVEAIAYASPRGDLRRRLTELIARYQRHKRELELKFVDPDTAPERVRSEGILYDGTLVLRHGEAKETVPPSALNEESLTNAFTRLGQRQERWLVFLAGHGERSPDRQANFDLSTWAAELRKRGFKTRALTLAEQGRIPDNTSALVIAGPRVQLLPGEVKEIERFVAGGGNLLWLADPGALHGLEPLAESLGVEFHLGTIIDPASQLITGDPTAVVAAKYGNHPVVRHFNDITFFPHAAGLRLNAPKEWSAAVLLDTRPNAWVETEPLARDRRMQFDKGKDIGGPVNFAAALARERKGASEQEGAREQRVVVIGDGDFLSNAFLANGGNLELGMSLANWLSQNDAYVSLPVRTQLDRQLNLSIGAQFAVAVTFMAALPLFLGAAGVLIWLRRRKL